MFLVFLADDRKLGSNDIKDLINTLEGFSDKFWVVIKKALKEVESDKDYIKIKRQTKNTLKE